MPKPNPILYSIEKTNRWFAIVSILLTACLVWLVYKDYHRDWKKWQRGFVALKMEKAREELSAAQGKVNQPEVEALKKQLTEAQRVFDTQKTEYAALEAEMKKLDIQMVRVKADLDTKKQFRDSYRYYLEVTHHEGKAAAAEEYQHKMREIEPQIESLQTEYEKMEIARAEQETKAKAFSAEQKELQKKIDVWLGDATRIERRIEGLKPSLGKELLNAPMLDFAAPTLRIQQVVLEDLFDDYYFAKTQKVDRCMTCHLGIDQKGFESAAQPFRTHPNLDLYMSAESAHPLEKVGCTSCHSGSGHSVDFITAAHTPRDEAQAGKWKKEYGWKRLEKWANPMLPLQNTEASCVKCHSAEVRIPQAEKLNKGRELAEASGCFGCHKVEQVPNSWKTGPSLQGVAGKLDREWMIRWLNDPRKFRPSTNMPSFFNLANHHGAGDKETNDAVIESIVTYLLKNSQKVELQKLPAEGDAARGEELVKALGCTGCHTAAGAAVADHGPELTGLGSKVSAEWLYAWLKDPKHYNPDTRMPNLRLSDQEAADITAYLLTKRNAEFDQQEIAKVKPEVLDHMVLAHLGRNMRKSEAEAEVKKMTPEGKLEYLGQQSIAFRGCYGCHSIKGFEEAKPIGTELSDHGRKDVHKLDFGLQHQIEHTREAWYKQKLKDPQLFDEGKEKNYFDKLRMPNFHFTDEEAEALNTFLLSLNLEHIPLQMRNNPDLQEMDIEKGRFLVQKLNCQGCHTVDGKEGAIRQLFEDKGNAPPVLDGEGAKVQEKWLHGFLKNPSTIRPWLKVRMPTFGLSDEEAESLVRYFTYLAKQEVSYHGPEIPASTTETLAAGEKLFTSFRCIQCHQVNPKMAMRSSFLAPDLALSKERLKPEWAKQWLKDPQSLQQGTMMPAFWPDGNSPLPDMLGGSAEAQITAVRDYLFRYAPKPPEAPKEPAASAAPATPAAAAAVSR